MRQVCALLGLLLLAGCRQDMRQQQRLDTYAPSPIWPDGTSGRPLPEGVVSKDAPSRTEVQAAPPPATPALLARGREQYGIFCSPCHGLAGDGDGAVVARGFPKPPSYHEQRLREADARHFFDVISDGYGAMYPYGARVALQDRWAIVAYIRALQLARSAPVADVPEAGEKVR